MSNAIVLDTNAWIFGTRLLKSPLGVAFLHTARLGGTTIILPEVVEAELYVVLRRECRQHGEQVKKALGELESLLGRDFALPPLPGDQDVDMILRERLNDLGQLLRRCPLTLKHARAALDRVIVKAPPADRTEEFRDAMIWEVVAASSESTKTYFITADKAFYADRNSDRGLAGDLAAQCPNVIASRDLQTYLAAVGGSLPPSEALDDRGIIETIDKATRVQLAHAVATDDQYLELLSLAASHISRFLTEKPDRIACKFELRYAALYSPGRSEEPSPHEFVINGEALLSIRGGPVISLEFETSQLDDGPVVSWAAPDDLWRPRRFADLARKRIRVRP